MTAQLVLARIVQHTSDSESWKVLLEALVEELGFVVRQVSDAVVVPPRASETRLDDWIEGVALALEHLQELVEEVEEEAERQHADANKLDAKLDAAEDEIEKLKARVKELEAEKQQLPLSEATA